MQCAVLYGYKELGNNAAVTGTQLPLTGHMTSDMTSYMICDITSDMTSKKTYEMTPDMESDMTFHRTSFFSYIRVYRFSLIHKGIYDIKQDIYIYLF